MYRIAICDDEKSTCSELETFVKRYSDQKYIHIDISVFYDGEKFYDYLIYKNYFDLIFLDIELPKKNGIEIGEYLRKSAENELTSIVYISSKQNYAIQLFKYRPIDFLIKPLTYDEIHRILEGDINRSCIGNLYFQYQKDKINRRVFIRNIIYFRSNDKKIEMMLLSGKAIIFNEKLSNIEKQMSKNNFLRIHKSYLINYEYVIEYTYEWIKMIDGDILSISKINRKEVKEKIIKLEMNKL